MEPSFLSLDLQNLIDQIIHKAVKTQTVDTKTPCLTLREVQFIASSVEEEANRIKVPIVFSAVDSQGHQILYFRMENALLISEQLAFDKAYTAAALRMPTHELAYEMRPGGSLYSLQNKPHMTCIGGGFPYWKNMQLAGAIAVSGGTVEQDMQIIQRALKKITSFNELNV